MFDPDITTMLEDSLPVLPASTVDPFRAARAGRKTRRLRVATVTVAAAMAVVAVVGVSSIRPPSKARAPIPAMPANAVEATPRGDQFIFVEDTGPLPLAGGVGLLQYWLSVDGRHNGLMRMRALPKGEWDPTTIYSCSPGHRPPNSTIGCLPELSVRSDLPTDPQKMLKHLYDAQAGIWDDAPDKAKTPAQQALIRNDRAWLVGDLLLRVTTWLPRESRAALFEALAQVPGAHTRNDVDSLRRRGTAIERISPSGWRQTFVYDPKTWTLLENSSVADGRPIRYVILRTGIVDKVGDRPRR